MNLKSKIESILFVVNKPLSAGKIAKFVEADKKKIKQELSELINEYKEKNSGIIIVKNLISYQMTTNPANADIIKKFLKEEVSGELTQPALETLTIIAYRGPISKPELEQVRGVNCGLILRNLRIRGLIEQNQGKDLKKKLENKDDNFLQEEIYYNVSFDFLKFLGISSIEELPEFEKLSKQEIF
ncbi:MAG: SMC-Scp complex subunit ScpB [Patescibacteria group bacterium]|nr:SMC-Scp complex subunit ScpB [Patescibacteria group bacterium]